MSTPTSIPDPIPPRDAEPPRGPQRRALLVAIILLSALTLWTLRALIPATLLGAWLAAISEPLSARFARRLGGRTRAAAALTVGLLLSLLAAGALLALPVVADVTAALRGARRMTQSGHFPTDLGHLLAAPEASASHPLPGSLLGAVRELAPLAEAVLGLAASVAFQLFVFVITAYYLAIDGRRLQVGVERASPFGPACTRRFIEQFIAVGRGIALSMGLTGLATATSLGLAFWAVGAPRPYVLGALAFVAAMLPVGAHIVWIPVALVMMVQGHVGAAIALTAVGVLWVGGVIDHVLRPWLVRFGRLDLHPLLTVLGLFGGVAAFGAWGVFVGPLIVAMTATAVSLYTRRPILARRSVVPGERVTVVSMMPAGGTEAAGAPPAN